MVRMLLQCQTERKEQGRTRAMRLATAILACLIAVTAAAPAQQPEHHEEGSLLPSTTGEPLTVKPIDLPDVHCTIVGWDKSASKPVLTLLCPPKAIFAPLRVYVKLSWLESRNIPDTYRDIVTEVNTGTKIHTTKESAWIWLAIRKPNHELRYEWVPFNGVVDVALIVESRDKHLR